MARWASRDSFPEFWDARAREVAPFIVPGSAVMDLGCGTMALERFLPTGCSYLPVDCALRDPRTVLCDFNMGEMPVGPAATLVTALGLCEYLQNLPSFFARLRQVVESAGFAVERLKLLDCDRALVIVSSAAEAGV